MVSVLSESYQCDSLDGDAGGDHAASDDGEAGAERVAEDAAHAHAVHVLPRREDHGGQLGPVAPLRQGGHREGLDEDLAQHRECGHLGLITSCLYVSTTFFLLSLPEFFVDFLKFLLTLAS